MTIRSLRNFVLPMLLSVVLSPQALADLGVIALNPTARIEPGDPALLRDVATLTGEPALTLASTVIKKAEPGAASFEVTTADIRAALTKRHANWGRLTLRGSTCQVRTGDRVRSRIDDAKPTESAPATVDLTGVQTVRTRMAELVGAMFGVENEDLRLKFEQRDAAILDRVVSGSTRVEIQPGSTASSSRMSYVVWIYEGERLEPTAATIRVDVLLRKPIVTASREIARGAAVSQADLTEVVQWIAPDGSAAIEKSEQAVGMRARRKIPAGTTIRAESLEPPIAAERGDLVKVHCVSGGVVVKAWARAKDKALEGEFVELQMTGSEKTFTARMTGRGVAVMELAG